MRKTQSLYQNGPWHTLSIVMPLLTLFYIVCLTGSGKTAAFLVPVLNRVYENGPEESAVSTATSKASKDNNEYKTKCSNCLMIIIQICSCSWRYFVDLVECSTVQTIRAEEAVPPGPCTCPNKRIGLSDLRWSKKGMKSLHLDISELEVKAFFVLNLVNIYPPREDHWGNFLLDLFSTRYEQTIFK